MTPLPHRPTSSSPPPSGSRPFLPLQPTPATSATTAAMTHSWRKNPRGSPIEISVREPTGTAPSHTGDTMDGRATRGIITGMVRAVAGLVVVVAGCGGRSVVAPPAGETAAHVAVAERPDPLSEASIVAD